MSMSLGGSGSEDENGNIISEINITPLTDIFLVLLIIFMVTSSVMSQSGVKVDLPKADGDMAQSQRPEGVVLTLLSDGSMNLNDTSIAKGDWEKLENDLRSAFEKTKEKLVVLEGDRKAYLGSAVEVMDHARKAGAERFAIATEPNQESSSRSGK